MIAIALARKPPQITIAACAVKYGTGALNIDASRVAHVTVAGGNHAANPHLRNPIQVGDESETNMLFPRDSGQAINPTHPSGRWPANLILEHKPGCLPSGTRIVRASAPMGRPSIGTENHGMFSRDQQRLPYGNTGLGYGNGDGSDTISAWDCAPGCPVGRLDAEGARPTGGLKPHPEKHVNSTSYQLHRKFMPQVKVPDSGSAARYFKQIGGSR